VIANICVEGKDYQCAIEQYRKAVQINPNFFPNAYHLLANIEMNVGQYAEAKEHYEMYLKVPGAKEPFIEKSRNRIVSCEFA
jgi:tetratricopeptide (TPR) repeat protein